FYAGPLPAPGQWTLLQVPASQVGLDGSTLNGMAFSQFDGRATWDYAGKTSALVTSNVPPPTTVSTNTNNSPNLTNATVWVDDSLPSGALGGTDGGDGWNWI